ncbi:retinal short-chain dehydrogenase reductase [Paxillus ammoniavirescens]|nr:retinal short-chain dehydrogenase reductase [Paxillus ammoniavirescens]
MVPQPGSYDATPMYDNVDIDMVVKVLAQTAFSPFFTFFIPLFYFFQGKGVINPAVVNSASYCAAVSAFWMLKWLSTLYRNQGSLFFAPKRLDWSEQIVVITGGSSGMGELLANTLAVRNVNVVVLDIKPIQTENFNITYYKCDVSKWVEVEAVSKRVIEEIGHPTMLVNNAGVVQGKLILDLMPEDIHQTFGVNTFAHFWTLKAFLPNMIERKSGHIVTMASVLGLVGCAQMTDYTASKAAVVNMHESLRYELNNRYHCPGIRTTLVCPGHVHTPLFSTFTPPNNAFYRFFVPSLPPVTVVKAIITALDSQQSQMILLPFFSYSSLILKLLPSFVRDLAQELTSADYAMQHFRKVTAIREDEIDMVQENKKAV